ncbi:hypothetical protein ACJX0J_012956, partial [Zea mays]
MKEMIIMKSKCLHTILYDVLFSVSVFLIFNATELQDISNWQAPVFHNQIEGSKYIMGHIFLFKHNIISYISMDKRIKILLILRIPMLVDTYIGQKVLHFLLMVIIYNWTLFFFGIYAFNAHFGGIRNGGLGGTF